jgi:hypothetical protein
MNIGIFIKKPENIFANGCIQQTYFLKKLFQNIGHNVDFLAIEKHYTHFELTNEKIIFTNNDFDFSTYDCVVLGSLVLLPETNQPFIDNLKSHETKIINLICGNVFILHQEEFVFNTHSILGHYKQDYFAENWVLEMYDYAHDYIQMLSDVNTSITPYVWDTDILDKYIENNPGFNFDTVEENGKVNLLLFEPNMSIHKNSLIPLIICDEYYKQNKERVNKVYIFCGDKVIKQNPDFVNKLDIYKDNLLESYSRIIMPYIIDVIKKNNPFLNIVVSYNLLNNLNFLHLEMFHLGIPIVHNCEPFKNNQMYFKDFELYKAVELIEHTRVSFDKPSYKTLCKTIISEFSPNNTQRIETYTSLFSKYEKTHNLNVSKECDNYNILDFVDPNFFYQGSGYVIFVSITSDIPKLYKLIDIIANIKETSYVEVFVQKDLPTLAINNKFNEQITLTVLHQTKQIDFKYSIKYSSFNVVSYVHIDSVSTDDFKVYTK